MLLGRASELEKVSRLVSGARRGHGGGLLVIGEPGIGKTALLDAAIAESDRANLVRITGIEAEANLPYAALGEAVAPLIDHLGQLPEPQIGAMEAALAIGGSGAPPGSRFATCAAFLGLLGEAARETLLLLVIDDAQWLDSSSAECFAYAARRLRDRPVALIAAARPDSRGELVEGGPLERIELSGLGGEESRALLRESAPGAGIGVIAALAHSAAGNPLALRELPGALSADQLSGQAPIDVIPAVTQALVKAFEGRFEALEDQSREAVGVASAAFDRDLAPVVAACRDLEIEPGDLERAESEGILMIAGNSIGFSHPLLKAVAYDGIAPAERRRAHLSLAAHCGPDARAWHLAAGTLGTDRTVAESLEHAAHRAMARGAHSVAADALQRAAEFTEAEIEANRRLYGAAISAALGGDYESCAPLLEKSAATSDPLLRARSKHGLAVIRMTAGMDLPDDPHEKLSAEAELIADEQPAVAAAMLADAVLLAVTSGRFTAGEEVVRRARSVLPGKGRPTIRCLVHSMGGLSLALRGEAGAARKELNRAGELLETIDSLYPATQSIVVGLHGRVCCGQEQILRGELARLIAMTRKTDTFGLLPYLLTVSADVAYRTGDWESSARDREAIGLAEEYGQKGILPYCLVVSGRLRAARGQTSEARRELERGCTIARKIGAVTVHGIGLAALGLLELGLGRTAEAIDNLEAVEDFAKLSGLEDPVMIPWAPNLVEAYVRAGRDDRARALAASLEQKAKRAGSALSLAFAARCRGLTEEAGFESHFEEALACHQQVDAPFETGRTLLAYGFRLHRARRRIEGRDRLRAALEAFEHLGAEPWSGQARSELRAAGAIKREPFADRDELSPQEIRVARAVADGATNREVAARMYLSPKTIEFHLGRVYRKLDIHSRTELATLAATGVLDRAEEKISSPL